TGSTAGTLQGEQRDARPPGRVKALWPVLALLRQAQPQDVPLQLVEPAKRPFRLPFLRQVDGGRVSPRSQPNEEPFRLRRVPGQGEAHLVALENDLRALAERFLREDLAVLNAGGQLPRSLECLLVPSQVVSAVDRIDTSADDSQAEEKWSHHRNP